MPGTESHSEHPVTVSTNAASAVTLPAAPVATSAVTASAAARTKETQSITVRSGAAAGHYDPVFIKVVGGILIFFVLGIVVMGVKTLRMRQQLHTGKKKEPDDEPVWPGLDDESASPDSGQAAGVRPVNMDGASFSGPVTPPEQPQMTPFIIDSEDSQPGPSPSASAPSGPAMQNMGAPVGAVGDISSILTPPGERPAGPSPSASAPSGPAMQNMGAPAGAVDPIDQLMGDIQQSMGQKTGSSSPRHMPVTSSGDDLVSQLLAGGTPVSDMEVDTAARGDAEVSIQNTAAPAGAVAQDMPDVAGILSRAADSEAVAVPNSESGPNVEDILARAAPVFTELSPDEIDDDPLKPEDDDLREFEELYAADPSNTSLLDYLASEYFQRGYLKRAVSAYEAVVDADPSRADAYQNMAACHLELGMQEEARFCVDRILALGGIDLETRAWAESTLAFLEGQGTAVSLTAEPGSAPSSSPGAAPVSSPGAAPVSSPGAAPVSSPGSAPASSPGSAPASSPGSAPASSPGAAPASSPTEKIRTEPGFQPELQKKSEALSHALEKREILTVYGGTDTTGVDAVKEQLEKDPDNPMLLDWYAFLLYSNDRQVEAIEVYRRLVEEFKPTANALYYLGNAYIKTFKYKEARQCWDQLKQLFPDSPLVAKSARKLEKIHALARKKLDRKRSRAGGRRTGAALGRISPKRVKVPAPAPRINRKSLSSSRKTEPISAIGSILEEHAKELSSEETQPVFTEYVMGDGSGVEEVEALLKNDPDNIELLDWAAFMNYTNGLYERSLEQYLRVLSLNNDNPQAVYYVGNIYARTGRYRKALEYWEDLLERYPGHKVSAKAGQKIDDIRRQAAQMNASSVVDVLDKMTAPQSPRRKPEQPVAPHPGSQSAPPAAPLLKNAELNEEDKQAIFTQYAQGDGSGAEEIEALLADDPDNVQLLDWAAFMNYTAGRYDKALEQYIKVIELDSTNPQAYYYVGSTLAQLERFDEAVRYWEELVASFPDHKVTVKTRPKLDKIKAKLAGAGDAAPAAPHDRSIPPVQSGAEPDNAAGTVENVGHTSGIEFILSQPTREMNEEDRMQLLQRSGLSKEEALEKAEALMVKVPQNTIIREWVAYLCYLCGNFDKSVEIYRNLLESDDDNPQAYYYLGIVLCRNEEFNDAVQYWNTLVSRYSGHELAIATKPNLEKLAMFTGG